MGCDGPELGCRGKKGVPDTHRSEFWFRAVVAGGQGELQRGAPQGLGRGDAAGSRALLRTVVCQAW